MNGLKQIVENLLRDDEKCRSDDRWLIIQTLRKLGFHFWIDYRDINKIPQFETITRIRRKIQNDENKFNDEEFTPEPNTTYTPNPNSN